jgi:hypothetical protein
MSNVMIRGVIPLILCFLQQNFFTSLFQGFIHPELLLCWLLGWGLLAGPREGFLMGLYCGFLADLSSPVFFGFYFLFCGFIGWFSGQVREQVNQGAFMLPLMFVLCGTVALQVGFLIIALFTQFSLIILGAWFLGLVEQVVWNGAFMLPIFGFATYIWYRFCE